jgi:hypothetical protein
LYILVQALEKYNRELRDRRFKNGEVFTTNKESEMSKDYLQQVAIVLFPDLPLLTSEQTDSLIALSLIPPTDQTPEEAAAYAVLITQYGRYEDAVATILALQATWNGRKLISRLMQNSAVGKSATTVHKLKKSTSAKPVKA